MFQSQNTSSAFVRFADLNADRGYVGSGGSVMGGMVAADFGIVGATGALYLGSNNATRMIITADGRVNIGTPSGYGKFVVNPNVAFTDADFLNANTIVAAESSNNTAYRMQMAMLTVGGFQCGSLQMVAGGTGGTLYLNGGGGLVVIPNLSVTNLTVAGSPAGGSRFVSAEQATPQTQIDVTVAHGGTRVPDTFMAVLRCKVAELGYAVGDEVILKNDVANSQREVSLLANAANLTFSYFPSSPAPVAIRALSTRALTAVTVANWALVFRATWS
jgi:hypothetical protein